MNQVVEIEGSILVIIVLLDKVLCLLVHYLLKFSWSVHVSCSMSAQEIFQMVSVVLEENLLDKPVVQEKIDSGQEVKLVHFSFDKLLSKLVMKFLSLFF